MSFFFIDSTARAAWAAATSQQAQLEGLRDEWSGQMSVRYYSSADAHLATVTHATPIVDTTTTPRSLRLGAWVAESHVQDGTAAYAILAVPAGADIVRAEVSLAGAISDPGGRVRVDIGTTLRVQATASLPVDDIPSWVPTTAWEWTTIPGTVWTDSIKDDGTGVVPALTGTKPPGDDSYTLNWEYSSPCYNKAGHELYMVGGGHSAGTINLLSRWNLALNTPTVTAADGPTPNTERAARFAAFATAGDDGTRTYFADGRPYSTHSYDNALYSDSRDELILFGFGFMASPGTLNDGNGGGWATLDVAGWPRGGSWRADGYYYDIPITGADRGPRFMSQDGSTVYYWETPGAGDGTILHKFIIADNNHSSVGTSAVDRYCKTADDGAGRALALGTENSVGSWDAKFINLSNGTTVSVTVGGDSLPSGRGIYGLSWCEPQGYWLGVFYNASALYSTAGSISAITIATITPTGADTATASVKTMTGTAPTLAGVFRGAFFDQTWNCMIVVQGFNTPLKAFKVA